MVMKPVMSWLVRDGEQNWAYSGPQIFLNFRNATFDFFDGQRWAEFKDLDVLRLHERA